MADSNPTGDGTPMPVRVSDRQREFLHGLLTSCLGGAESDLAIPEQLVDPDRTRREADAYRRVLAALRTGSIVPDTNVVQVLERLQVETDDTNGYEQILLEHRALCALLGQLAEGRA
jgi:hypothetical protein